MKYEGLQMIPVASGNLCINQVFVYHSLISYVVMAENLKGHHSPAHPAGSQSLHRWKFGDDFESCCGWASEILHQQFWMLETL